MPDRIVHFDMDLTNGEGNTSSRLAMLIKECANLPDTEKEPGVKYHDTCSICRQRIIELAIREEYDILLDVLNHVYNTYMPSEGAS